MVHSVGGTLLKHLEEHQIQGNRGPEDTLMYFTTTGWMMWNWMVSALALGKLNLIYIWGFIGCDKLTRQTLITFC